MQKVGGEHLAIAVDEIGARGAQGRGVVAPAGARKQGRAGRAIGQPQEAQREQHQDHEDADAGVILGPAGGPRALESVLEAPDPRREPARQRGVAKGLLAKAHRAASATWIGAAKGAAGCGAAVRIGSGVTSTATAGAAKGLLAISLRASSVVSRFSEAGARPR